MTAAADGGAITSDAGALLLREAERSVNLIAGLAPPALRTAGTRGGWSMSLGRWCASGCMPWRLAIEDLNDHEGLRFDPMVEILSGTLAPTRRTGGPALAGKRIDRSLDQGCFGSFLVFLLVDEAAVRFILIERPIET